MNKQLMSSWERVEFDGTPIYIRANTPDWFVPNSACDRAFMELSKSRTPSTRMNHILRRIDGPEVLKYQSRTELLQATSLKECWIHITNRCNMACRHCMFSSSPHAEEELSPNDCGRIIKEARDLGCRLFFFTGGEPFVSKSFFTSVEEIFQSTDTHVVVLTNLSLISQFEDRLQELPRNRLHFQVSLDGLKDNHDAMRGAGAFQGLCDNLATLKRLGFPVTLSMTVTRHNVHEMKEIVDFADHHGISNIHFLWLFKKGNAAGKDLFAEPDRIFENLKAAQGRAEKLGVRIDNIETIRSQVFSYPGTRYDLCNAGWQSLAVGPDGRVYPTPALIYTESMQCGHIGDGLGAVWKKSPILDVVRNASLNQSDTYGRNPFRYLIGGGDMDHSLIHSGRLTGGDPYAAFYTEIAKWLIARESKNCKTNGYEAIRLKMGEKLGDCPAEGSTIFFTHSNCVLSLPGNDTHTQVNRFYTEAAKDIKEDILNPVCYDQALVAHIPEEMRVRSYGCGSPVLEAGIRQGEAVVDLGSGTGIECLIAARLTGPKGRVVGIDMGDAMLGLAQKARASVVENLRYDNITFKKAFLEDLPLEDRSMDVVISNCVVNLSPDKRRVFQEIYRVLKPGGRLVISDITYEGNIPIDIKYNETLRGECIGGALGYHDLFGLLNDMGFSHGEIIKGYPYRTVKGHVFHSITYQAVKPPGDTPPVLYDFPDFKGVMAAVESEPTCACFTAPEEAPQHPPPAPETHRSGCMVCGEALVYLETNRDHTCHYCGLTMPANALCAAGHFVCDVCHGKAALDILKQVCLHSREPDAVALMQRIRSHPHFPVHGPEHHSLVPAVILAALRNAGEEVSEAHILTGIERGQTIAGGACAFFGACGAAIGVGIAFSVLTGANPYDGAKRQVIQQVTGRVLGDIAAFNAPRCCQRDSWLALQAASTLLSEKLKKTLSVGQPIVCNQFSKNKECIHSQCPLWPRK